MSLIYPYAECPIFSLSNEAIILHCSSELATRHLARQASVIARLRQQTPSETWLESPSLTTTSLPRSSKLQSQLVPTLRLVSLLQSLRGWVRASELYRQSLLMHHLSQALTFAWAATLRLLFSVETIPLLQCDFDHCLVPICLSCVELPEHLPLLQPQSSLFTTLLPMPFNYSPWANAAADFHVHLPLGVGSSISTKRVGVLSLSTFQCGCLRSVTKITAALLAALEATS